MKLVQQWERRWSKLESDFITVTEQIIQIEELVSNKSFIEADEYLEELKQTLDSLKEEVEQLMAEIKSLKQSEERSRSNVTTLKEAFDKLKYRYENEEMNYAEFKDEIKVLFKDVEVFFLKFNECMEECNYDLADETLDLIKSHIEIINHMFDRVPMYQEMTTKELKPLLREVLQSHHSIVNSGVYLSHLQIEETIAIYYEQLDEMSNYIKCFDFDKIETMLLEIHDNAKQMIEFMKKEYDLQDVLKDLVIKAKGLMKGIQDQGKLLQERYDNIKGNYRLPEAEENQFDNLMNEIQTSSNELIYLVGKVDEHQSSNSSLVRELSSLYQRLTEMKELLVTFDGEIESLYSGEKECRQRALYLLKTFNHLKGIYHLVNFPVENEEINEMIKRANFSVQLLFETIGRLPINIAEIDEQLMTVQEIIEVLSNRIETEVQQAKLAERLIVYAHRYIGREGMYVVELTIAEDQFRQGNYATVIQKVRELLKEIEGSRFDLTYNQFKQQLDCYLL